MKPSRLFYMLMGATLAGAVALPVPGPGLLCLLGFVVTSVAALAFDHQDD